MEDRAEGPQTAQKGHGSKKEEGRAPQTSSTVNFYYTCTLINMDSLITSYITPCQYPTDFRKYPLTEFIFNSSNLQTF